MTEAEKINYLKDNHLTEWLKVRRVTEDELSEKQTMFCVCGRLATGLHESNCRKFNQVIDKETMKKLKHLLQFPAKNINHT